MSAKVISILEFRNKASERSSLSNQINRDLEQVHDVAYALAETALAERSTNAQSSSGISRRITGLEDRIRSIVSKLRATESAMNAGLKQSSETRDEPCY